MVKLRLRRLGKKKQPIYKIVAADSRAARTGKFLEAVGTYNPRVNPMLVEIKEERVFHWLKSGAQPSDTVRSLFQRTGLWLKWGLMKKGADESTIASQLEKWQSLQAEKQRREAEKKARRKAARKAKPARSTSPSKSDDQRLPDIVVQPSDSGKPAAAKQEAPAEEAAGPPETEKPTETTTA